MANSSKEIIYPSMDRFAIIDLENKVIKENDIVVNVILAMPGFLPNMV